MEQAAAQKKDRATMDGEERERKMLEDQIARARALAEEEAAKDQPVGLQKAEGEKVKLSLAPTPVSAAAEGKPMSISFGATGTSLGGGAPTPTVNPLKTNPLKANPLKRPAPVNVFKATKAAKTDPEQDRPKEKAFMSEAERLMKEDQARKAARANGPSRR